MHELNITLVQLATWWNQRARTRCIEECDTNSKFFHDCASARRNVMQINQINYAIEGLVVDTNKIEATFFKLFTQKWK